MSATAYSGVINDMKEYYGKDLKSKKDFKTSVCKVASSPREKHVREALSLIHEEVVSKYYGCGLCIPQCLEGMTVLDLGSGCGHDCFAISKLVGEYGHVTGVDMTEEQLETANKYIEYHREKFGYGKPNVKFVKGYIEKMDECGLVDNSFDIIISNCVINLSPDKPAVLREAFRLLKEGGELYFSDMCAERPLPEHVRNNKVLWGEGIGGALLWPDLVRLGKEIGFSRPRIVQANEIVVEDEGLREITGNAKYAAVTCRLFKLPAKREEPSEIKYKGTVTGCASELKLDFSHIFKTGSFAPVDREVATIIKSSRFADKFEVQPAKEMTCCATNEELDPFEYLKNNSVPTSQCVIKSCS